MVSAFCRFLKVLETSDVELMMRYLLKYKLSIMVYLFLRVLFKNNDNFKSHTAKDNNSKIYKIRLYISTINLDKQSQICNFLNKKPHLLY
jgi:hypothetical protein